MRTAKTTSPCPRVAGPRDTLPPPRRSRARTWSVRVNRALATGMFILSLAFTLFAATGASQSATAQVNAAVPALGPDTCSWILPWNNGWDPVSPGVGGESLLAPSDYTGSGGNDAKTPLEKYGTRGLVLTTTRSSSDLDEGDGACPVMPTIQTMLANQINGIGQTIASVTIAVRQGATDASPFIEIARGLRPDTSWLGAAAVTMVMLSGVWMLTKGISGQARSITSGVLWIVIAITGVTWLLLPTKLTNTGVASDACSTAAGRNDPDCGRNRAPSGDTPIYRSDPNYFALTAKANDLGHDISSTMTQVFSSEESLDVCKISDGVPKKGARTLDCVLWSEMAFKPWAQAQFGGIGSSAIPWKAPNRDDGADAEKAAEGIPGSVGAKKDSVAFANGEKPREGEDVRLMMLRAQAFSYQEAAATGIAGGPRSSNPASVNTVVGDTEYTGADERVAEDEPDDEKDRYDATTKNGLWNQVRVYMAANQEPSYGAWSGQANAGDRLNVATMSLFGNVLIAALVISTSLLTLMWYAVVVLALLMLPIVGTLSIYPPAQKFLRGLAQIWVKGLILAAVFTVAQTFAVSLTGSILASNVAYGWKAILLVAAIMGMFKIVKMAREDAFTPNLNAQGAAQEMDVQQVSNRVSPIVAGAGYMAGRMSMRAGGRVLGSTAAAVTGRGGRRPGGQGPGGQGPGVTLPSRVQRRVGGAQDWAGQKKDDLVDRVPIAGQVRRGARDQRDQQRDERRQARQDAISAADESRAQRERVHNERARRQGKDLPYPERVKADAERAKEEAARAEDRTPNQGAKIRGVDRSGSQQPERRDSRRADRSRPDLSERGEQPTVTRSGSDSADRGPDRARVASPDSRTGPREQPTVTRSGSDSADRGPDRARDASPDSRTESRASATRMAKVDRDQVAREVSRETRSAVKEETRKADESRDAAERARRDTSSGGGGGDGRAR